MFAYRHFFVLACFVAVVGCGSGSGSTAHLAGTVTIKGKPIPAEAKGGLLIKPESGKVIKVVLVDGKYDSPETPVGSVNVFFDISQPVGPVKVSERTGKEYQETRNLVPPEHEAGISVEVTEDNLSQDFDL